MAKSALCIGIVSVLATGASGGGELPSTVGSRGRDAAERIVRACTASPECLRLGTRAISAATERSGDVPGAVARVVLGTSTDALADVTAAVPPLRAGPTPPHGRVPRRRAASHR